jgi:hypothetical protein
MFIKYVNETTKQYKVYVLDLQITVRFSVVDFKEKTKRETVNLNFLRKHLQSTLNVLTIHKLIRKLKELLLLIIDLLPCKELNNFKIVIPL